MTDGVFFSLHWIGVRMMNRIIQVCLFCVILLPDYSSFGSPAQTDELQWPHVVAVEFVDNPRYSRETQAHIDSFDLSTNWCLGIYAGWSFDSTFFAGYIRNADYTDPNCYRIYDEEDASGSLALLEAETQTITTVDLTIPLPPSEREGWMSLYWSPFSPNQIAGSLPQGCWYNYI